MPETPCETSRVPKSVSEKVRAERAARAQRVEDYCKEHGISVRQLSLQCGWDGSHLGTVLRRWRAGGDVRDATTETIAREMGVPPDYLRTGHMPAGIRVADLQEWPAVSAAIVKALKLSPESLALLADSRVPEKPDDVEAFLFAFAQAWKLSGRA